MSEQAIIIALNRGWNTHELDDILEELVSLSKTAGAEIIKTFIQRRDKPVPSTLLGKGKIEEIKDFLDLNPDISLVLSEQDLTPAQIRNLEQTLEVKVVDRTGLILDIFAQRAQSLEGKLQVEYAQLSYMLPRLTRMWTHLSRQRGGIGTRGPGETQLEVDRRRILQRLSTLKRKIAKIRKQRAQQRKQRRKRNVPVVALLGYTNVGKSTILNAVTSADVLVDNKLFATLDPTVRRVSTRSGRTVLLTDTVGLIRRLPHLLVDAFRATLEEITMADLILNVVDVSYPEWEQQHQTVINTLEEIIPEGRPGFTVFNKSDLVKNLRARNRCLQKIPGSICVSALTGEGLDALVDKVDTMLDEITAFKPRSRRSFS
jgi:GTP-binding protein HflX